MVYALPLGLGLIIMLPIMGYLMLNDLGKYLKKWLDSKPSGRKEDEEKIMKYTIAFMLIMQVLIYIKECVI